MNPEVTEFINAINEPWQGELAAQLREIVLQAIPEATERIQYKKPHFLKNGKYAAAISTSKDVVSFTIFNTAALDLPEERYSGPPERKTLKLRKGEQVEREELAAIVSQASATLG